MTLSGFTYIRNGIRLGYPFLPSIQTLCALCDEVVVAVGDGDDGSREAILALNDPKISIVDTVWDMSRRDGGKVFADQANAGLAAASGNWLLHLQADELIHEHDFPKVHEALRRYDDDEKTQGFIFPFLHFWGGYQYYRNSRRMHRYEIRMVRRLEGLRSYGDSQGFRLYSSEEAYQSGEKGVKLAVRKVDAPIYHYNHVRPLPLQQEKLHTFDALHSNTHEGKVSDYQWLNFNRVDRLAKLEGSHPALMQPFIGRNPVPFDYDPGQAHWEKWDRYLQPIEDVLGFKIGEYKNYKLIHDNR